jgi:hypothetical protein
VETNAHLWFLKKVGGALWVCIWNQGGGGPKILGTTDLRVPQLVEKILTLFIIAVYWTIHCRYNLNIHSYGEILSISLSTGLISENYWADVHEFWYWCSTLNSSVWFSFWFVFGLICQINLHRDQTEISSILTNVPSYKKNGKYIKYKDTKI